MGKQNSQTKTRKKGNAKSIIIQIVLGAIIGIFGVFGGIGSKDLGHVDSFPLYFIFLLLATFININIHEFGHFIVGKLFGYTLISYRISIFSWNNENGRMKASIRMNKGYSGLCAMIPPDGELESYKQALFYAGGIILNLITGMISIVLAKSGINSMSAINSFLYILGSIAILLGVINLIPFLSNNYPTDGKLILGLISNSPYAKRLIEINKVIAQLSGGVRPRELKLNTPEIMTNLQGYDLFVILYAYFKSLDSNNLEGMLQYIKYLEENIEEFPHHSLPPLYFELCFVNCITSNEDMAITYYKKAGRVLEKDQDINGLRIKAYFEYYINKNPEEALKLCDAAIAVADKFPIKGQAKMEETLILKLRNSIINN